MKEGHVCVWPGCDRPTGIHLRCLTHRLVPYPRPVPLPFDTDSHEGILRRNPDLAHRLRLTLRDPS